MACHMGLAAWFQYNTFGKYSPAAYKENHGKPVFFYT